MTEPSNNAVVAPLPVLLPGADVGQLARQVDIDVDRMTKNEMLQFVASNKLIVLGFYERTIPEMKEALKKHLQVADPPEGGWIRPALEKHQ